MDEKIPEKITNSIFFIKRIQNLKNIFNHSPDDAECFETPGSDVTTLMF